MKFKSTLFIGAVALAAMSYGQDDFNKKFAALKGHMAPAFSMTDTNGRPISNKSLHGKVVVLDFWATWCGPCKRASPAMQKLHKTFGSRGLVVIGAETMEHGAAAGAKAYSKEHGYTYTFTTNNDALTTQLGLEAIPAFMIIGRDGKVVFTQTGVQPNIDDLYSTFAAQVKRALVGGA